MHIIYIEKIIFRYSRMFES